MWAFCALQSEHLISFNEIYFLYPLIHTQSQRLVLIPSDTACRRLPVHHRATQTDNHTSISTSGPCEAALCEHSTYLQCDVTLHHNKLQKKSARVWNMSSNQTSERSTNRTTACLQPIQDFTLVFRQQKEAGEQSLSEKLLLLRIILSLFF